MDAFDLYVELIPGHVVLVELLLGFSNFPGDVLVLSLAKFEFVLARGEDPLLLRLEGQMTGDLWIVLEDV